MTTPHGWTTPAQPHPENNLHILGLVLDVISL